MKTAEILSLVDEIAQSLVFGNEGQVDSLGNLPDAFGELAAIARDMGCQEVSTACVQARSLATRILDGSVDWAKGMDVLGKTADSLQACLENDCSAAEAGFPPELVEGFPETTTPANQVAHPASQAMDLVDDEILGEFLSRQKDTLPDVEKLLLALEQGLEIDEAWLLRYYHTLKGESALIGLSDIAILCHATEDMIQKSSVKDCQEILLDVNDWVMARIRNMSEETAPPVDLTVILGRLEEISGQVEAPVPPADYEMVPYVGQNILQGDVNLLQEFIEEAVEHLNASEVHLLAIETDPKETEALNAVFRGFHTIKGLAGFVELNHVKDLAHKAENLLDMARRNELELAGSSMDAVFDSVDMMKRLLAQVTEVIGGDGILKEVPDLPELMSRLVVLTSGEAPVTTVETDTGPAPEPVSEAPKTSGFIPLGNMNKKPAEAKAQPETPKAPDPVETQKTVQARVKVKEAVRVDSERLDRLIETIGELVIAESMVTQSPEIKNTRMSVKLAKDVDHLDKICRELQEIGMSLRMVPVRPVFQKMARLVRDLGKKTNRQIDFFMSGEDTELDKNVVDKIGDPLVHMVRNSVDHGIEPSGEERLRSGKPERGRVELRAFHKGGNICIEIEDDGRGLDKEAILQKAVSRGLVHEGENLGDREIFNLIFEAGFSTAQLVTEVSGRGVGMDVVHRNIEELRGTVEISSEAGKGSIFSMRVPLTLAIIEGMVIMVGQEHYIIPTLSVVRLVRPQPEEVTQVFGKGEMLDFEGEHLPLFRLSGLFDIEEAKVNPHEATVVVVEDEGRKIGLMADELLGQQSIVIKSLGESVQGTDGVAGGAIMSDGNVALILDIAGIVRVAHAVDTTKHVGNSLPEAPVSEPTRK